MRTNQTIKQPGANACVYCGVQYSPCYGGLRRHQEKCCPLTLAEAKERAVSRGWLIDNVGEVWVIWDSQGNVLAYINNDAGPAKYARAFREATKTE